MTSLSLCLHDSALVPSNLPAQPAGRFASSSWTPHKSPWLAEEAKMFHSGHLEPTPGMVPPQQEGGYRQTSENHNCRSTCSTRSLRI